MDKHLLRYKGSKWTILLISILTVGQGIAIIFQAVFLAKAISDMFHGAAPNAALPFFFGFLCAFFLRYLFQWGKERISYRFAEKTSDQLQSLLMEKIIHIGPRGIGILGSGNLVTLCMEGIPSYRTYIELFIPRFLTMIYIPIILLAYIFRTDTLSGIVLIITMPIMIIFLILLGSAAQKQINAQMGSFLLLSRHFVDSLRGLVTLKYLGKSKSHQKAIEVVSNQYRIATMKTLKMAFLSTFSLDFFSSLSVAVLAVELGLRLVDGKTGLEAALIILILAPEYFLPVRTLGNDYHATMNGKEAGKRISKILDQADLILPREELEMPKWNQESVLQIEHLSKQSETEKIMMLRDISFSVKGYQKVGIIGTSGSGKSTLIDILSGFLEASSGSIMMDGALQRSLRNEKWQEQITYIPQHPYIFSGSVAENISWYAPDSTREEIERVVQIVGLKELIQELPNGLDEKIGQGGRELSGGEEQRIALSRSLLQNRPIMLFDEPTAHLDIETEYELKKLILPVLEDKLVFFATHRLHWMEAMDVIFLLEEGRIIEMGTHGELLAKKDAYYHLFQANRGEMIE